MTIHDYETESAFILSAAQAIEDAKRPGYTIGSEDVLANFKRVAARVGVKPGVAWAIYFLKHVDAITSMLCRPDLPVSEAAQGRFSDAINYLKLGWALYQEEQRAAGFEKVEP